MKQELIPAVKGRSPLEQKSLVNNVLVLDAVVSITKKSTRQYQVMTWFLVACVLVMLVKHLLSDDGQNHANTSAKNNGDNRVCEVVTCHLSVELIVVRKSFTSFGRCVLVQG